MRSEHGGFLEAPRTEDSSSELDEQWKDFAVTKRIVVEESSFLVKDL